MTGRRPAWLPASGACADLIAAAEWSGTALGPVEGWPQPLRTALGIALRSSAPMAVLWGERGLALCNDGFASLLEADHPGTLGGAALDDRWRFAELGALVTRTCFAGGTLSLREQEFSLDRDGAPGRSWFDIDCVPILGGDGKPAGALGA